MAFSFLNISTPVDGSTVDPGITVCSVKASTTAAAPSPQYIYLDSVQYAATVTYVAPLFTYCWITATITVGSGPHSFYAVAGANTSSTFSFTAGVPKPTDPAPADASGPGIDFSGFTLSWVDGGGAETYDVYIGESGDLTQVSLGQVGTSYVTDLDELETIFDASPVDQVVYWRVDAKAGESTATGDEWSFDPRPAQVTNPTPTNAATGQRLYPTYAWGAAAEADTYTLDVTVGGSEHLSVPLIAATEYDSAITNFEEGGIYGYDSTYAWRVDSVNQFGTTTGTAWSFTSVVFDPPMPTWENLPDKTLGPLTDGTKGTDYRWTGLNNTNTVKYLLVAKDQSVYFAEVY